ncbi:MAG: M48 family metalloprotease, partial [Alphaproteobacteria bacterium]|nr:M48 family metalloprotease [Alphaproteobacteria bacterium]
GPQLDPQGSGKGLPTPPPQGRSLGRRLPCKPYRRMIPSPDSPGLIGGLLLIILAPLAAALVQTAISRTREYEADRGGATICGQPIWLADALTKIHQGARQIANPAAEARPSTAHLFIINPLRGGRLSELFSTHPPTSERVRRLRLMPSRVGGGDITRLARATGVPNPGPAVRHRGVTGHW